MRLPHLVRLLVIAVSLALFPGASCRGLSEAARGYAVASSDVAAHPPAESAKWTDAQWGGFLVTEGDFGTLTTDNLRLNAVPWKLFLALPDVVPEPFFGNSGRAWQVKPDEPLRRFGFVYNCKLTGENVVQAEQFALFPVGYSRGMAKRTLPNLTVELAATNCTACHGGRGYDAKGNPTAEVWWGVPNHSLNFDGLVNAVVTALTDKRATDEALLKAIKARFPQISDDELKTYRKLLLPAYRKELGKALKRWGGVHAWKFGGPGLSHGNAIVKEELAPDLEKLKAEDFPAAYTKIPNIYAVTQKTRLLIDGSYSSELPTQEERFDANLLGFLPVFGTPVDRAIAARPQLPKVRAFLDALSPPKFPGAVNAELAGKGKLLYGAHCKSCHGDNDTNGRYVLPSQSVKVSAIGTDPTRALAVDPVYAKKFNESQVGKYMKVERTEAYLAPSLHGVWCQAPYFHNGSVPTLWAVLTPGERPRRFYTGGHRYDLGKVGIDLAPADASGVAAYPSGYVPWSEPVLFDTSEPGRSNAGHEKPGAGLSAEEKWALIEYLKVL